MKKYWRSFIHWLMALYIHRFVEQDRREKCPSCGIRQFHPMRYDTDSKKILHMCSTLHAEPKQTFGCGAIWSTNCLVDPSAWEAVVQSLNKEGDSEVVQPEKKFHTFVSREPTIIRTAPQEKAS